MNARSQKVTFYARGVLRLVIIFDVLVLSSFWIVGPGPLGLVGVVIGGALTYYALVTRVIISPEAVTVRNGPGGSPGGVLLREELSSIEIESENEKPVVILATVDGRRFAVDAVRDDRAERFRSTLLSVWGKG